MKRSVRKPVPFGVTAAIVASVGSCGGTPDASVEILFASGPDDSGIVQSLVEAGCGR